MAEANFVFDNNNNNNNNNRHFIYPESIYQHKKIYGKL